MASQKSIRPAKRPSSIANRKSKIANPLPRSAHFAPDHATLKRNYNAALISRLTDDWAISPLSADAETRKSFRILRARSREVERNDPYLLNFLRSAENNVIGSNFCSPSRVARGRGNGLQMKAVTAASYADPAGEQELDFATNRSIEEAWKRQCRRENFLVTRDMTGNSALKLILRATLRDFDCIIRKIHGYPNESGFALQLFEGDYLDDTYNDYRTLENGNEIRMGVELDARWKFPVAYWLLASHPGDFYFGTSVYGQKRLRIPVNEIILPTVCQRIGGTRTPSPVVAAMARLQMLGGYDEAELVAARAGAQKMGFLEKEVPQDFPVDEDYGGPSGRTIESEPGQIEELPMGFSFKEWDPKHPNEAYADFIKTQLRGVAAALGISYTTLASNLEDVNFSSIRAGLLEERENWKSWQVWFIDNVLTDIFEDWLRCSMLSGFVRGVPFADFARINQPEWKPRRWPWVDPVKEVAAAVTAISNRLDTRSNVIGESGGDFEDLIDETAAEEEYAKSKKVDLDVTPEGMNAKGALEPDAPDPDEEEDEDEDAEKGSAKKKPGPPKKAPRKVKT